MEVAGEGAEQYGANQGDGRKHDQGFGRHPADTKLISSVFFTRSGVKPSPPADEVGDEEKDLQEHVRVQLNLVEHEKGERNVDDADRPTPDVGACRQPHGNPAGKRGDKFQVAYRVAPGREKDIVNVEK